MNPFGDADRVVRAFTHTRLGRRGACLVFFGALDVVYAWSMITASPAVMASNATYRWFDTIAPLPVWAAVWAAVGVVCLTYAFLHHDRHGFIAAIGIKVLWGLMSLAGAIMSDVTAGSVGIWLGLAGLVWVISGWPEPELHGDDGT